MGKIFGISSEPVAKAFPSLEFGREQLPRLVFTPIKNTNKPDMFVPTATVGKAKVTDALKYAKRVFRQIKV